MVYILLVIGFFFLIFGAKCLVHASSKLASILGFSPLIIGLTVVAYGTNSPELFVSAQAALMDKGEMAIGNIIGSNIFNILAVLGISSLIRPLIVCKTLFLFDVPIMILVTLLFLFVCFFGQITLPIAIGLLLLVILYTIFTVVRSKQTPSDLQKEFAQEYSNGRVSWKKIGWELLLIVVGLILLVFGSEWFVDGASHIARLLGVSDVVIGLTLVAIGSSLPELATSIYAILKKEYDIAVGNIVGSNIFNILGVLGIATFFAPDGIPTDPTLLHIDVPILLFASSLCVPLVRKGAAFGRWKGGFLLLIYIGYVLYTIYDPNRNQTFYLPLVIACIAALFSLSILQMRRQKQ